MLSMGDRPSQLLRRNASCPAVAEFANALVATLTAPAVSRTRITVTLYATGVRGFGMRRASPRHRIRDRFVCHYNDARSYPTVMITASSTFSSKSCVQATIACADLGGDMGITLAAMGC
jgi:hypothetical protein